MAFPEKERVPFFSLMFFSLEKEREFLAFSDFDKFVGTAYIVLYKGGCYIFYLAFEEDKRGYGYGSRILPRIGENYNKMNVILDV